MDERPDLLLGVGDVRCRPSKLVTQNARELVQDGVRYVQSDNPGACEIENFERRPAEIKGRDVEI